MDNETTATLLDEGKDWTYELIAHWPDILHGLLIIGVVSQLWKAFYRLYLHPLASIPGPRLASISSFVIRVAPNRVHVNDVEFFETVFRTGAPYYKEPEFYSSLGADGALASLTNPAEHRKHRVYLSSLFSAQTTVALKPRLLETLKKAAGYLRKAGTGTKTVDIQNIYSELIGDVVCELMFADSYNFIDSGDQGHPLINEVDNLGSITWLMMEFPGIKTIIKTLPTSFAEKLSPQITQFKKFCDEKLEEAQHRKLSGTAPARKSYFDLYLEIDSRKATLPNVAEVFDGAFNFMTAGIHTTAYTLSWATFNILNSPFVLAKLQAELDEVKVAIRDEFDPKIIQSLPYLGGVIRETMRMADPVPGFLPRVVPKEGVHVGSSFLPGGTSVSVSHPVVHMDPTIFPEPHTFNPDRWVEGGEELEKYSVPFGKGSRRCIGISIAYMELYAVLAYMFSHFSLELADKEHSQGGIQWADRIVARATSNLKIKVIEDRWA
ncbi:Cytochrome P450 E-class group I [Penicillium malachiteum]|uniref:Cytochrome P450 E-class group I n=1 Tax=Penicillium malachiteum TaxID=1324776 RepID=UPI00254754AD|nr:Cytochrome P450 E-class group I [Penicillium malachiteum]KAJ5715324.1 Cytochrome P450 E-class group I [Penicillium malachiteum]